jgi:hypothetical protein
MGQSLVPEPPDKMTGWTFKSSAILDISIVFFNIESANAYNCGHLIAFGDIRIGKNKLTGLG